MQWHKKGAKPPKNFKVTLSAGKLMVTVFWASKGDLLSTQKKLIILLPYLKRSLRNLNKAIIEKILGKLIAGVLLFHEYARYTQGVLPRLLCAIVTIKKSNIHPTTQVNFPA